MVIGVTQPAFELGVTSICLAFTKQALGRRFSSALQEQML